MLTMSQKEFQRQVQRLKRRDWPDSVGWVPRGNRGRSMPWAVSIPQKQLILTKDKYQGQVPRASTILIGQKNFIHSTPL
jgi:hypothetical protein